MPDRARDRARCRACAPRARHLPTIVLSPLSISDVELLAIGAVSPLTGFLIHDDYERVVTEMRLTGGQVWSIPITLPVDREIAGSIKAGQRVALQEPAGHILAIVTVQE